MLNIEIKKSQHSPSYRVHVTGSVRGIQVVGNTTTYFHGLDATPTLGSVDAMLNLNRADGTGRTVPKGVARVVLDEVLAGLLEIA